MNTGYNDEAPRDAECAVLVPSCDAYADLWRPFFTLFWRHWADCPFPVHLGVNEGGFADPRVRTLPGAHGTNWTNRVRDQVTTLRAPYVLLMLEDFFLQAPIDTLAVARHLRALRDLGGHMVRLVARPGPRASVPGHEDIGDIPPGTDYRVSTQAAIWRRESLLDLMRTGETIWEFELRGSRRSDAHAGGYYAVWRDALTYRHHVVERGKWFPWAARRFGRMDIGCDFTRRQVMSPTETASWLARKARGELMKRLPQPVSSTLRTAFSRPLTG